MAELWAHPAVLSELREMFAVLEDQSSRLTYPVTGGPPRASVGESRGVWDAVPLSVHASYSLDEVLTAFGEMTARASVSERATRTERAGRAARERACRGVRGAEPLG